MKIELFIALAAFVALSASHPPGPNIPPPQKQHLLGEKECTWGPSYWCQNLTAAAGCHATKHCIQTVWIHKQLPPDTSSICQTCLDMVKQARDQLESNETQELIKEVFEGSCALLHIKAVVKECDKIADNYIPDLIDTLASQMNPQVVCSVAGLCNNDKLHGLIDVNDDFVERTTKPQIDPCQGCHTVVDIMENKFKNAKQDEFLQGLLQLCGKASSLSDACSNIVITYFTEIYNHVKYNLNADQVCLMSGQCSAGFHQHADVEITPISHIGYVPVNSKDDLPCELCEQLVNHLRDLLVANTTELEFKQVLEGLCKQTKSFKDECLALVDEYYTMAYQYLIAELNSNELCILIQICQANNTNVEHPPIMPLLPVDSAKKVLEITQKPIRVNMAMDTSSVRIYQTAQQAQLPIDRLFPPHAQMYNTQTCVFCEYLLHYLQQVITNPTSEDEIKHVIDGICERLPISVNSTCVQFVDMYEPALVALLAQEIDPSQVCPLLKCCPSNLSQDVEVFMHADSDGGKCPMCLFAVTRLEQMVKTEKTEANIKDALSKLCSHLPKDLAAECNDFVETYTTELVELLIADLTPQEVCVYLKLCTDSRPPKVANSGDPETNNIADDTINGRVIEAISGPMNEMTANPQCVLCEFVMKEVQDELKNNATESEIENLVHGICNKLPKSVRDECNGFVNQYADTIIQLLIEATVPNEICRMMHMCSTTVELVKVEVFDCAICETIVYIMEKILANPTIDHNVNHILEKTCRAFPARDQQKCIDMVDKYGKTIYDLILTLSDKGLVCKTVGMCAAEVNGDNCSRGPGYWCQSEQIAEKCGKQALSYCERVGFSQN